MGRRHVSGFLAGMVLDALVGTALGMLLAPKNGRQNREAVLERAPELRTRAPLLLNRATEAVRDRIEEGRAAFFQGQRDARERLERELRQSQHIETAGR